MTVGTGKRSFDRLLTCINDIAKDSEEEFVVQKGCSDVDLHFCRDFRFTDDKEMIALIDDARIIISHAGAGTMITALKLGKPLIVVPRLKKFKECIDDQQVELAEMLSSEGKVAMVTDVCSLRNIIKSKKLKSCNLGETGNGRLVGFLKSYLESL